MGAEQLNIINFSLVYLLLLIVLGIMKACHSSQTKLLLVASLRLTVQLILAGFVLGYIFEHRNPLYTLLYILAMILFAIHRVLSRNPEINSKFKWVIAGSLTLSGLALICFFVTVVVEKNIFNPQYTIPLGGMIIGNAMTGLNLAVKTLQDQLSSQKSRIETLLNLGAEPKNILLPFANNALETALLPTLNSMLGMGIVALPGMMTGQILSGTLPGTAILYQISIMIAVCTVVCLCCFLSMHLGCRTLYNKRKQISIQTPA